jgi:hypothetical protein
MTDDCEFHAVAGPDLLGRSFIGRDAVRQGFERPGRPAPTRNGPTACISSPATAGVGIHLPRHPRRRAPASRRAWSTCSPSATARSRSRTPSARTGRRSSPEAHDAMDMSAAGLALSSRPYDPRYDPLVDATPGRAATTRPPTGWPPPARRRPTTGRCRPTSTPTWRSSAPASPAWPRRSSWRASTASRPRCWRPTAPPGAAPAATAARARTPAGGSTARSGSRAGARTCAAAGPPRSASGFETFKSLVAEIPDCEPQDGGHLYIAHRAQEAGLPAQRSEVMRASSATTRACCRRRGAPSATCKDPKPRRAARARRHRRASAEARLRLPAAARALGVRVHPASPVTGWRRAAACTTCARPAARCARARWALPPAATPATGCTPA